MNYSDIYHITPPVDVVRASVKQRRKERNKVNGIKGLASAKFHYLIRICNKGYSSKPSWVKQKKRLNKIILRYEGN